jgi:hypothetical protein
MESKVESSKFGYKITSEIYDLGGVRIYRIEPGIIVSEYYGNVLLDIDLAVKINKQICRLTEGKAVPQLFLACEGLSVTKQVREWGTTSLANRYTSLTAVVCNQLAHKILGNFVIKVQKPFRPTKMFSKPETAIEWLISKLQ